MRAEYSLAKKTSKQRNMNFWICYALLLDYLILNYSIQLVFSRKHRSVVYNHNIPVDLEDNGVEGEIGSSVDFVWYTQTVAAGDTAVLHCSFDAIFAQLRNGNIDWARQTSNKAPDTEPLMLAEGKKVLIDDRRYRVYRPHNSALSVLMIRRAKKRDAGIYRCNLSGSSTRHKFMALNVTKSKIEAHTSPPKMKTRIGRDVTMWCNATGYPKPVVYWTREDRNHQLQDGSYQYWGTGLHLNTPTEEDTGVYACYLDNFVQPVVSYRFSLSVEDSPWMLDAYKMRFDSKDWLPSDSPDPIPVRGMSYLLMCQTNGTPKPMPSISWLRDGEPLTNTKHFYIIEDRPGRRTVSSTLVIMRFVPRFQGNYTCSASNIFRTRSETFEISRYLHKPERVDPGNVQVPSQQISSLLDISVEQSPGRAGTAGGARRGQVWKVANQHDTDADVPGLSLDASDDEDFTEKGASGDYNSADQGNSPM